MNNLIQVMLNPIRMRIIQHLATCETATARDLVEQMPDIPRTTVYRHLKILSEADVLVVVSENRVRGTLERVYSLNRSALATGNNKENATRDAFGVLITLYADFARYFANPNPDPGRDRLFMNKVVLIMSDEEYDQFLGEIAELITRHIQLEPSAERKPRNLALISSPNIE